MFNKKEFIQQKVGGRMSDTKKHNFMRRLFHFLYRTRDTLYQLMSVDIVPDRTNPTCICIYKKKQSAHFMFRALGNAELEHIRWHAIANPHALDKSNGN